MNTPPLSLESINRIKCALECSWSGATSDCYNPTLAPKSYGQCAPTAIVVLEVFGGEILRTEVKKLDGTSVHHFYNRIGGERFDFTADQFSISDYWCDIEYLDILSSTQEAISEMLPGQLDAMRRAFQKSLQESE